MINYKRTGRIVGILFLVSYLGIFVGSAFLGSTLESPFDLGEVYPDRTRVTAGLLLELLNDGAVIGIAVMVYPLLRRVSESLALWYVGLRIVEGVLFIVGKISALSLIPLSEAFIDAGSPADSYHVGLGDLALDSRTWAGEMAAIAFVAGALLLYYLLLRSELVPRFISIWGLAAAVSLIVAMSAGVPDLTQDFEPAMLLYFPIVLNELFLAGWLLVKGFTPPAAEFPPEEPRVQEPALTR